jgi:hypothetical protein
MSIASSVLLPFTAQYPAGHGPLGSAAGTAASSGTVSASASADSVSLSTARFGGSFTADAGDTLSLSSLYTATAPTGGVIGGYLVALSSDQDAPNDGTLELNGVNVTNQVRFTPDQFDQLHFIAGPSGSSQNLVVVAQTGTANSAGVLTGVTDSSAVQLTATITGTRSVNAAGALLTPATGDDAGFVGVAQQATILNGFGGNTPPTLTSVGNLTAAAGDALAVSSLYTATPPSGGAIAGYEVALRGDQGSANAGTLELNGVDVTGQVGFTPDQFDQLQFIAGPSGSSQDLVVVARTGTVDGTGALSDVTDSAAVAITASVTGTRSVNAAGALLTPATGGDASFVSVARQATIFTGFGANTPPTLTSVGNLTAAAGDTLSLSSLYAATPPSGGAIAGYQVALGDDTAGGTLMLNGVDVTGQVNFTPDQFDQLSYVAGASGTTQSLVVVAQTGTANSDGALSGVTDSAAVAITASVTGTRSVDAAAALLTPVTGDDANFISVARQATIFDGFGTATPPTLDTVGNLTADAGDTLALSGLYTATAPSGQTIAGYQVALRDDGTIDGGGTLMLNGVDVTDQVDFTPDQFDQLHYVAGTAGGSQDLVVVARTGTPNATGALSGVTDSAAVAITARVTGTRSINAAGALLTPVTGGDSNAMSIAQQASIFTGFGATTARPTLSSVGNLTAAAGDTLSLSSLYTATPPGGGAIAGYRVALGDDTAGGSLMLNGVDVTGQVDFTPDQFDQLSYVAGASGTTQSLVVVAQTGTANSDGTLSDVTDSPAVQITASVTGTRSINAAAALATTPTGADADFVNVAQQAAIDTAYGANTPPTLTSVGTPAPPSVPADQLAASIGAYQSTGGALTASELLSLYAGAVGDSETTAASGRPAAGALGDGALGDGALGGEETAGNLALQQLAIAAYQSTRTATQTALATQTTLGSG